MTGPTLTGPTLHRTLGLADATLIGLGAMIGAGIFTALTPAAAAAGSGLLIGLAVAAVVAYCNATSSARLAALYPVSGGTYVYGRERLGPFWGYLAGWGFVVGKTASCAAVALTVGVYAWPAYAHQVAVIVVLAVTAINLVGVQKSARVTTLIVVVVVAVLAAVVVSAVVWGPTSNSGELSRLWPGSDVDVYGVLQSAGILFFAFAGYARIATLSEEVRDPEHTIGRAIRIALAFTLVVYAAVAVTCLWVLGPSGLANSAAPLADTASAVGAHWLTPVVRVAAAVAATGSLLALILGVSRTTLAMARDRHLPAPLAAIHPRFATPHRAEIAVGIVVAVVTAIADIRSAIGFSSFGVLVYYAIANASAFTLRARGSRRVPIVPVLGAVGCLILTFTLPLASVLSGLAVLALGAVLYGIRLTVKHFRPSRNPAEPG